MREITHLREFRHLIANRGASLVLAGHRQPAVVHVLAHALNDALLNKGKTVRYHDTAIEQGYLSQLRDLLNAEKNAGIKLTESFAMHPGASVSGLYFSHPEAKYFGVGQIARDQVVDYAARRDESVAAVEKRLAPNLGYEI